MYPGQIPIFCRRPCGYRYLSAQGALGCLRCNNSQPNAVTAVMQLWAIAFNLMQLFFYRRLNKARRGRPVNDSLVACVEVDVARPRPARRAGALATCCCRASTHFFANVRVA